MCPDSLLCVLHLKPHKKDIKYKSNIVQKQTSDLYYNVILTPRLQALANSLCLRLSVSVEVSVSAGVYVFVHTVIVLYLPNGITVKYVFLDVMYLTNFK